jgi:hypothetical protein
MEHAIDPMMAAAEAETRTEQINLQRIDEASAVPRPVNIGVTYSELENEALEDEQPEQFAAAGIEASRPTEAEAAGLAPAASAAEKILGGHEKVLEAAEARLGDTLGALSPFRRRPPKAARWHYAAKSAFLVGDVAGISSAAIMLGEIPGIALVMAGSAAAATVAAGLSGTEVRDVRNRVRRARDADKLSEQQQPFAHLFEAPDRGWPFVKALCWVSVSIASTIACSIFALRSSVEDPLVGLVFGGIAASIAAASWVESYMYADDIADLIANAEADYKQTATRHQTLAGAAPWKRREEALVETDSITREHDKRGIGARLHLKSLRYGILRRNAQVVGHGPAAEPTTTHQTARRGGTK